jgi:transcriptional regulator with XRE-family HTH domain
MKLKITIEDLSRIDPNISVVVRTEELNEIKNRIIKKHKSLRQFSKKINCSASFISNFLNGRIKSTRLIIIQKIINLLDFKLEDIVEKIIAKCRQKCFIPIECFPITSSPELASLVGRSFGD